MLLPHLYLLTAFPRQGGWAEGGGPVATVKLVLETGVGVITRAWPLTQPAQALRVQLSHTTQVPAQYLQVSRSLPMLLLLLLLCGASPAPVHQPLIQLIL